MPPGHSFVFGDGKSGSGYVFFVRDPADKWVSGFNSRLRQGCPALCNTGGRSEFEAFHE